MAHIIYCITGKQAIPVGYVFGSVYQATRMICLNPHAPSIRLRTLQPSDKQHWENFNPSSYTVIKLATKFNLGSIMGSSGVDCFHFTVLSLVLVCVPYAKVVLSGTDRPMLENKNYLLIDGDVRMVFDQERCWIYLLRGIIYNNGKFFGQNKENNCSLKMIQNTNTMSLIENEPQDRKIGQIIEQSSSSSPNPFTGPILYFIGYRIGNQHERIPIALIIGSIFPAPLSPYRYGGSLNKFDLIYTPTLEQNFLKHLEMSEYLVQIVPLNDSIVMLYSTTGEGIRFYSGTEAKIQSQVLLIDEQTGTLISRRDGRVHIRIPYGIVKFYICDDNLILLDCPNSKMERNIVQVGSAQPPPPPLPSPSRLL